MRFIWTWTTASSNKSRKIKVDKLSWFELTDHRSYWKAWERCEMLQLFPKKICIITEPLISTRACFLILFSLRQVIPFRKAICAGTRQRVNCQGSHKLSPWTTFLYSKFHISNNRVYVSKVTILNSDSWWQELWITVPIFVCFVSSMRSDRNAQRSICASFSGKRAKNEDKSVDLESTQMILCANKASYVSPQHRFVRMCCIVKLPGSVLLHCGLQCFCSAGSSSSATRFSAFSTETI